MQNADEYLKELNTMRTLVFLECDGEDCEDDAKNIKGGEYRHFHQVKLSARQFKSMTQAIILSERADDSLKDGYNMANIRVGGTFAPEMFEGLSSTIEDET